MSEFTENNHSIQMEASDLDINAVLAEFDDDPEFKSELQSADVLLIPTSLSLLLDLHGSVVLENLSPEREGTAFPETTRQIFDMLSTELGERATVNAVVKDDDYIEFALRSEDVILPIIFIAKEILLQVVVDLLIRFLYDRLSRGGSQKVEGTVKCELHFEKNGIQLSYKYDGPADKFEQETLQHIRELLSNEVDDTHVTKEDDTSTSD